MARLGEDHWRAKLTDRDVELVRWLLAQRRRLVGDLAAAGVGPGHVNRALIGAGLSFRAIARKLECSEALVRAIGLGRLRTCPATSQWAAPKGLGQRQPPACGARGATPP